MSFQFQPLNILRSASLAATASYAFTIGSTPETASVVGYAMDRYGPQGAQYLIRSASGLTLS